LEADPTKTEIRKKGRKDRRMRIGKEKKTLSNRGKEKELIPYYLILRYGRGGGGGRVARGKRQLLFESDREDFARCKAKKGERKRVL